MSLPDPQAGPKMRTFEYRDEKSNKFWSITLAGNSFTVSFGKIGTAGQSQTKTFADAAAAKKEHDKLVAEKLKKGYKETTRAPVAASPPRPVSALQRSLEEALAENPDDLASHAAYADYLQEQGDPRGEFIQVQLALEDEKLSRSQRARLEPRERELLDQHARTWLGELAGVLTKEDSYRFARGWLDTLSFRTLEGRAAVALARAPEANLLRRLLFDSTLFDFEQVERTSPPAELSDDVDEDTGCMTVLAASPYLSNVRVLRAGEEIEPDFDESFGCRCYVGGVERLIARLPRLEELHVLARIEPKALFTLPTLGNLRILQFYHNHEYPFALLGANPAVRRLATLLCHPACYSGNATRIRLEDLKALCESPYLTSLTHLRLRLTDLGDEGVRMLIERGMLKRLKILDLRLGSISDDGARMLVECPDLKRLDWLNLSRNALTPAGVAALAATGVRMNVENQHEEDDEQWYEVGDYE